MRPQEVIDTEREQGRAFGPLAETCRLALARGLYCECREPSPSVWDGLCGTCENTIEFDGVLLSIMRRPRCTVCGGPRADGSGCPHCPRVDA